MMILLQKVIGIIILSMLMCQIYATTRVIPTTLNIGFMSSKTSSNKFDLSGTQSLQAMIMALKEINNKTDGLFDDLLPNTQLQFVSRAPKRTFVLAVSSAISMTTAFNNKGIVACVGPASLSATSASSLVYNDYGILSVSHGAYFSQLSYANTYNYLLRTIPSTSFQGRALADIAFTYYGWKNLAVFTASDVNSVNAASEFAYQAREIGLNILSSISFTEGTADLSYEISTVQNTGAQIFVLLMNYTDAVTLLQQGADSGLFTADTQLLGMDSLATPNLWKTMSSATDVSKILKGMITVTNVINGGSSPERNDFVNRWRNQSATNGIKYPNGTTVCDQTLDDASYFAGGTPYKLYEDYANSSLSSKVCAGYDFGTYFKPDGSNILYTAYYAYDAVHAVVKGLHNLLYNTDLPITAANLKAVMISTVQFDGVTGPISFSTATQGSLKYAEGDRKAGVKYQILNFQTALYDSSSGASGFATVGTWVTESGMQLCDPTSASCSKMVYNTASNSIPQDAPSPIYLTMDAGMQGFLYFMGSLGLVVALGYLAMIIIYRNTKIMKASQPIIVIFIIIGGILAAIRTLAGAEDISDGICEMRLWTGHLAFMFVFMALVVKLYRIHLIVNGKSLKRVTITTVRAVGCLTASIFITCIYLIAVNVAGNPHEVVTSSVMKLQVTYESSCQDTKPAYAVALYVMEGILLSVGGYLCYATKDVPDAINESSYIGLAITSIIFIILMAFPIIFLLTLPKPVNSMIEAVAFSFAGLFALNILFVPKIVLLLTKGDIKFNRKAFKGLKVLNQGQVSAYKRQKIAPEVKPVAVTGNNTTDIVISPNASDRKSRYVPKPEEVAAALARQRRVEATEQQITLCHEQIKMWREQLLRMEQILALDESHLESSSNGGSLGNSSGIGANQSQRLPRLPSNLGNPRRISKLYSRDLIREESNDFNYEYDVDHSELNDRIV